LYHSIAKIPYKFNIHSKSPYDCMNVSRQLQSSEV